jgi:hypothetical protein
VGAGAGGAFPPTGKRRRRHGEGSALAPAAHNALKEQRWLLQHRAGGKRPVKPNETFASYVAPTALTGHEHSGGQQAASKKPPRQHSRYGVHTSFFYLLFILTIYIYY